MTSEQIILVRNSFAAAAPQRPRLAQVFFAELFAREPSLRLQLDNGSAAQSASLFRGLSQIVASLDRLYPILPALEWLAERSAWRGIGPNRYAAFAQALLAALEAGLGDAFTAAVREAWVAASRRIAGAMALAVEPEPLAA